MDLPYSQPPLSLGDHTILTTPPLVSCGFKLFRAPRLYDFWWDTSIDLCICAENYLTILYTSHLQFLLCPFVSPPLYKAILSHCSLFPLISGTLQLYHLFLYFSLGMKAPAIPVFTCTIDLSNWKSTTLLPFVSLNLFVCFFESPHYCHIF